MNNFLFSIISKFHVNFFPNKLHIYEVLIIHSSIIYRIDKNIDFYYYYRE